MKSLRMTLVLVPIFLAVVPAQAKQKHHRVDSNGNAIHDPRPAKWCGWWLRHQLGVADKAFNRAIAWKHYGSPAGPDCVNCIAVFAHHVGLVTGRPGPGRIILKSGNDGHAVRERERSSRGVIAWRRAPETVLSFDLSTTNGALR